LLADRARRMEQAGAAEGLVDLDKLLRFQSVACFGAAYATRILLRLFYSLTSQGGVSSWPVEYRMARAVIWWCRVAICQCHAAIAAKSERLSVVLQLSVRKGQGQLRGRESMTNCRGCYGRGRARADWSGP